MDSVNQEESSGGPSGQPTKKRRGRPPRDPSAKRAEAAHVSPDSGGKKEHIALKANEPVESEFMVGQAVTGVVVAEIRDGYVISVKIGNSAAYARGVAFKTGGCVPITPENDIAPNLPMITGNDIHSTTENLGGSHGLGLARQTDSMVPAKRKYARAKASTSVPLMGAGDSSVLVVDQSVPFPSGPNLKDNVVHIVEPLSMIPAPGGSIGVGHIITTAQSHPNLQVSPGSGEQDNDGLMNDSTSEGKLKPVTPTDVDTPGASQMSDGKAEDGKEALKSSADDSGIVSMLETGNPDEEFSTESMQDASVMKPAFSFGTGMMTDHLQAVQGNMTVTVAQTAEEPASATAEQPASATAEQPSSATDLKCYELTTETDQKDEAESSDPNASNM